MEFFPLFDINTKTITIVHTFDFELHEFKGVPLARHANLSTEEEAIEFLKDNEDRLPFDVQIALRKFLLTHDNTYDGILD